MSSAVRWHGNNAQLTAKYGRKGGTLGKPASSVSDVVVRMLLQVSLMLLWKALRLAAVPLGRIVSSYVWCGRTMVTLCTFVEKLLAKVVGWLSAGTACDLHNRPLGRLAHFYFRAEVKRWHLGLAAIMVGGLAHTVVGGVHRLFDETARRAKRLQEAMALARSYEEWRKPALELEQLRNVQSRAAGRDPAAHEDYDRKLLSTKTSDLRKLAHIGNFRDIMWGLRVDLIRNVANIATSQRNRQTFVKVPEPISRYINSVQTLLSEIVAWPNAHVSESEKLHFYRMTHHTFGRTALMLSGGGGLGTFHLGVCKALFERQLLPRVLAGSSVGSIVCGVMGTRTDAELKRTFDRLDKFDIGFFMNRQASDMIKAVLRQGHMQDVYYMVTKLRQLLGDYTFLDAYELTGRILNVSVCPADTNEPPCLLNYMTAPQALIWSAVAASSSFPGLYPPQHLLARNHKGNVVRLHGHGGVNTLQRRWRDGSLEFDLPVKALAEMFNCNNFMVSQTNPHIVPLVNFKSYFPQRLANIMEAELKHRLQVVQWLLPEVRYSKYLTLWTQPWEGDITFTLPNSLYSLSKTIANPTVENLVKAVILGEHAVWERMSAIGCNCAIEATLDSCLASLQENVKEGKTSHAERMGNRVPSWMVFSASCASPQPGQVIPIPVPEPSFQQNLSWGDLKNFPGGFTAYVNNAKSHIHLPALHRPLQYTEGRERLDRMGDSTQSLDERATRPNGVPGYWQEDNAECRGYSGSEKEVEDKPEGPRPMGGWGSPSRGDGDNARLPPPSASRMPNMRAGLFNQSGQQLDTIISPGASIVDEDAFDSASSSAAAQPSANGVMPGPSKLGPARAPTGSNQDVVSRANTTTGSSGISRRSSVIAELTLFGHQDDMGGMPAPAVWATPPLSEASHPPPVSVEKHAEAHPLGQSSASVFRPHNATIAPGTTANPAAAGPAHAPVMDIAATSASTAPRPAPPAVRSARIMEVGLNKGQYSVETSRNSSLPSDLTQAGGVTQATVAPSRVSGKPTNGVASSAPSPQRKHTPATENNRNTPASGNSKKDKGEAITIEELIALAQLPRPAEDASEADILGSLLVLARSSEALQALHGSDSSPRVGERPARGSQSRDIFTT